MSTNYSKIIFLILLGVSLHTVILANPNPLAPKNEEKKDKKEKKSINNEKNPLIINGTNSSTTIVVNSANLLPNQPITITTPAGFTVKPKTIPVNSGKTTVTVTYTKTLKEKSGVVVLRSGSTRSYVYVKGIASSLPKKDISSSPIYTGGEDEEYVQKSADGFTPGKNGFTVEFKVNTNLNKEFAPYVVTKDGVGFKAYVTSSDMGLYNSKFKKEISNPETSVKGGLGKFYNDDDRAHTYRYAVTSDKRIFIYRDGLPVDTVLSIDYGLQPDFAIETGDPVENLLKNPDFEGEFTMNKGGKIAKTIEGWDILIDDIYNSEQYIVKQEINNEQDFNNQILQMKRYQWSDGWSAAEITQIVDVTPNETYTLSALVRGGFKKKDGTFLGKIKIYEIQNNVLGTSVNLISDNWETYSMDYTTSPFCKQICVLFYLERDKKDIFISPLEIDNIKLTGKSCIYKPKIGFNNKQSLVEYFTYDLTDAYAPLTPQITVSSDN